MKDEEEEGGKRLVGAATAAERRRGGEGEGEGLLGFKTFHCFDHLKTIGIINNRDYLIY